MEQSNGSTSSIILLLFIIFVTCFEYSRTEIEFSSAWRFLRCAGWLLVYWKEVIRLFECQFKIRMIANFSLTEKYPVVGSGLSSSNLLKGIVKLAWPVSPSAATWRFILVKIVILVIILKYILNLHNPRHHHLLRPFNLFFLSLHFLHLERIWALQLSFRPVLTYIHLQLKKNKNW